MTERISRVNYQMSVPVDDDETLLCENCGREMFDHMKSHDIVIDDQHIIVCQWCFDAEKAFTNDETF